MKLIKQSRVALLALLLAGAANAAQVCDENLTPTTPDSRFQVNEAEVTDTQTGLIWQRCAQGQSWNSETSQCAGTVTAVHWKSAMELTTGDWRVPNIKELQSIMEHACASPSMNMTIFPIGREALSIWSSTPARRSLTLAVADSIWIGNIQYGTSTGGKKDFQLATLLVKDAATAVVSQ